MPTVLPTTTDDSSEFVAGVRDVARPLRQNVDAMIPMCQSSSAGAPDGT